MFGARSGDDSAADSFRGDDFAGVLWEETGCVAVGCEDDFVGCDTAARRGCCPLAGRRSGGRNGGHGGMSLEVQAGRYGALEEVHR